MKCMLLAVCIVLVAYTHSRPQGTQTLQEKLEAYFKDMMSNRQREVEIPLCNDEPCCKVKAAYCAHDSTCTDVGADNFVHKFGYQCIGADVCGTDSGEYAGINCDIPADTACDDCDNKHPNGFCMETPSTYSGILCYNSDWEIDEQLTRELDIMYGPQVSLDLTRIAKEYNSAKEHSRAENDLGNLLQRLLKELE